VTQVSVPLHPAPNALVQQTIDHLITLENFSAAIEYLASLASVRDDFVAVSNLLYRCGDVLFELAMTFTMRNHATGLQKVQHYGTSCAPKLIRYHEYPDQRSCVLVTQVDGISQSMPVPCHGLHWRHVTQESKHAFLEDVRRTCCAGFVCLACLYTDRWSVVPSTGAIVISDWSKQAHVHSAQAAQAVLRNLAKEFADRGI